MLPQEIKISTKDILYSEKILLPKGKHFDTERRDFIKNLDTIDLQAVPGSGKTTALLAKLLILERYMSFENGAGILVISHTNAAIDEIKDKIQKYCPKLFTYPNFIGTIQSFVDQFLAIPFYSNKYRERPYRIDNEIYHEKIKKHMGMNIKGFSGQENKNGKHFLIGKNYAHKIRFEYSDGRIKLVNDINGKPVYIEKPRKNTKNWIDFSYEEKVKIKKWATKFKLEILENYGVLHFDDAYFLATAYLKKNRQIINLLQKRFPIVFVDEMQDMEKHQYDLLDELFYKKHVLRHCYQRIGDKNQAIHTNGSHISENSCWVDHGMPKTLLGSHRLTKRNAEVVQYFGLNKENEIIGLNDKSDIKPHIIVYEDPLEVLPKYTKLISDLGLNDEKHPFMAIGWTTHKTDDDFKSGNTRIQDYHKTFNKSSETKKIDFDTLSGYLTHFENKNHLASIRKNILNAIVKIIRIEGILDENNRNYTISKLIEYLKQRFETYYKELKLILYQSGYDILSGKTEETLFKLRDYIPTLVKTIFEKESFLNPQVEIFLNTDPNKIEVCTEEDEAIEESNIHTSNGVNVKLGTVHSIKGKTLTAVLYLETFYEGNEAYESLRLSEQFKKTTFYNHPKSDKKCHIQSTKMVYVGLSRPTDLLCFAVYKGRFEKGLSDINKDIYEVI